MWESETSSGPSSLSSSQGAAAVHIIKCQCVLFSNANSFAESIDAEKVIYVERDGIDNQQCNVKSFTCSNWTAVLHLHIVQILIIHIVQI